MVYIIGLDCATDPKKVGLAMGRFENGLIIESARLATSHKDIVETSVQWLSQSEKGVLALDAPLGWPVNLGKQLANHFAGVAIEVPPHNMFRRSTDIEIKNRLGQQPLDVGADRIARTAMAALMIVHDIQRLVPVLMGWTPGNVQGMEFIEVYPAATLKALGIPNQGYKKKESLDQRREILKSLPADISEQAHGQAEASDDVLDACICAIAAADYASGIAVPPIEPSIAKKEGWIWAR